MVDGIVNPTRSHRGHLEVLRSLAAPLTAALLAAALVLACGGDDEEDSGITDGSADGDGDGGGGDSADDASGDGVGDDGPAASDGDYVCSFPEECAAVSSTCCGCPDFAVRADSGYAEACEDVECEPPTDCPAVHADCVDSLCVLVCEPVVATHVCENGFARDALDCLIDVCRTDPPDPIVACEEDADCVQVSADCCGCDDGGADTAVNVDQEDAFLESLACRRDPACPGVNLCDASQVPRCLAGACTLSPSDDGGGTDGDDGSDGGDGPPEAEALCGAPELPPCPTGQCVLNDQDAEDATRIGVGTCRGA